MRPKQTDNKYLTGTIDFDNIQYERDLENRTQQLCEHVVIHEFHCERFDFGRDKKCEQQCSDCHWMQTKSQ